MLPSRRAGPAREFSSSSSLEEGIDRFLQHLKEDPNYARHTLDSYGRDLRQFVRYLYLGTAARRLSLKMVKPASISEFLNELGDRGLKQSSKTRKLAAIRSFFRYLCRKGVLAVNPSSSIRVPKAARRPPLCMPLDKVEMAIGLAPVEKFEGARDRAILEVIYGGGVRLGELVELNLSALDLGEGSVRAGGSGGRERVVPLGRPALEALGSYLEKRTDFLVDLDISQVDAGALFLNRSGRRLSKRTVQRIVKRYLSRVAEGDRLSPNILRHSYAAHLLEAGAELEAVQELLGQVAIAAAPAHGPAGLERLRRVYSRSHPRS